MLVPPASALGCVMKVVLSIFGSLLLLAIIGLIVYFVFFHNKNKASGHQGHESKKMIQMIHRIATQRPLLEDDVN